MTRPAEGATVETWADSHRVLPPGSAVPGPWRTAHTPYLRGPMSAVTDPHIRTIVLWTASQMAKTEFQLNTLGFILDTDPAPALFFSANQELIVRFHIAVLAAVAFGAEPLGKDRPPQDSPQGRRDVRRGPARRVRDLRVRNRARRAPSADCVRG